MQILQTGRQMTNNGYGIGTALHRPTISPDGNLVAVVVDDPSVDIFGSPSESPHYQLVMKLLFPRSARNVLLNASIIQWSPEVIVLDEATSVTWLLLSDGNRVIVTSVDFVHPSTEADETRTVRPAKIVADYQIGDQFGKVVLADFVFNHQQALLLFDMNTHGSIISLTKPQRDDIPSTKFNDSRGFVQSQNSQYFALLLRSKGQDQISVFSSKDEPWEHHITFSPQTIDAQDLLWSPDGTPILAVWDAPAFGPKIMFYTGSGHCLKQLELSSSSFMAIDTSIDIQGLGITHMKWVRAGPEETILAVANGNNQVLTRFQHTHTMTPKPLATFIHANIIDGNRYIVWQEESHSEGPETKRFTLQKNAFDIPDPNPNTNNIDTIQFNSTCAFLATKLTAYQKAAWLWEPSYPDQPHTVIVCRDNIKQLLWHPDLPNILLIVTTQKTPTVYIWYNETKAPTTCEIPIPKASGHDRHSGKLAHNYSSSSSNSNNNAATSGSGKWEISWLRPSPANETDVATNKRYPLMISSIKSFDIGYFEGNPDGMVRFESALDVDRGFNAEIQDETAEDGDEIVTPTKVKR